MKLFSIILLTAATTSVSGLSYVGCEHVGDCLDHYNYKGLNGDCGNLECDYGTCKFNAWKDEGHCSESNFVFCDGDDHLCDKGPSGLHFDGTCTGFEHNECVYTWLPDGGAPPPPPPPPPPPSCQKGYYLKHGKCVQDDAVKYKKCTDHGYSLSYCKKKYGRRLNEINARHLVEKDEHSECANSEYDMFLVVRGAHFAGLAVPGKGTDGDCPMVAFHAEAYENDPTLQKVAVEVDEEHLAELGEDNKLHLGSKNLSQIVTAFETAPVNKQGVMYDAISNNCVAMLRNMADPLEIPVDERMITFITGKLLQGKSEHIFNMMKESPALAKLYEGGRRFLKGVTNEELLAKVIKLYV